MITIKDTSFTSDVRLSDILYVMKKDEMVKIANRLDLYVSPNITKEKMATRLANAMLEEPIEIVSRLSKSELLLLEELINAGPNKYVEKKMRKTYYLLQKWGLILTHEDEETGKWYLLMPDEVRESLSSVSSTYIAMVKEGKNGPSAKELRMVSMLTDLLGHRDFTIANGIIVNNSKKENI